jgi:uncharacterized membrane protein YczE
MRYFTNLEFYADRTDLGSAFQRRRNWLVVLMYVLLSLGIFAHEAIDIQSVSFKSVRWGTLGASCVIGLALLPPIIRWLNKRRKEPSFEQVLAAFSVGFFVDLSSKGILAQIPKLLKALT